MGIKPGAVCTPGKVLSYILNLFLSLSVAHRSSQTLAEEPSLTPDPRGHMGLRWDSRRLHRNLFCTFGPPLGQYGARQMSPEFDSVGDGIFVPCLTSWPSF